MRGCARRASACWKGCSHAEVQAKYPEVSAQVERKSPDYVPPGGESLAAAQERGIAALTDLARRHPGERLIVVSHGALLGMFLRHALGIALDRAAALHADERQPELCFVPGRRGRVVCLGDG